MRVYECGIGTEEALYISTAGIVETARERDRFCIVFPFALPRLLAAGGRAL